MTEAAARLAKGIKNYEAAVEEERGRLSWYEFSRVHLEDYVEVEDIAALIAKVKDCHD